MPLRSAEEYARSLRDGRSVHYRQRVSDITAHPVFRVAIDHAGIDFRMVEDPRRRGG